MRNLFKKLFCKLKGHQPMYNPFSYGWVESWCKRCHEPLPKRAVYPLGAIVNHDFQPGLYDAPVQFREDLGKRIRTENRCSPTK